MIDILNEVDKTIHKYNMIEKNDTIIVALSGGPDSLSLLHILYSFREKYNLNIYAAHINHCIRGDEADKDETFVVEYCKTLGIRCFVLRSEVEKFAKEKGISSEMAGREIRYDFFQQVKNEVDGDKIALAHNANDQAETILMRLMRGTGIEGLEGIKPVRDNLYIRPLIEIKRTDIEEYCERNHLNPRIDATNLETIYSRNKVRLELIPYIERNFNKDIINTINRFSEVVKKDNDFIESIAEEKFKNYCGIWENKVIIDKNAFINHSALVSRIIRKAFYVITESSYNFEKKHVDDIIELQKKSSGKSIDLVQRVKAYNNYGNIELTAVREKEESTLWEYSIPINYRIYIKELNIYISAKLLSNKKETNFSKNYLIRYFDYDKIKESISLRNKRDGDAFIPFGMKGKKKLKDYFINEKIPKEKRQDIPILCFDESIAWIIGYRTSESYKITENTKNILKVEIEGEVHNGELFR